MIKKVLLTALMALSLVQAAKSDTVFHDNGGHVLAAQDFQHKWVIINYWASWCDSCLAEVPELNNFYHDTQQPNLVMYGVNYDHLKDAQLQQDIKSLGIHFPVLQEDPTAIWHLGALEALPVTFIINPQGKVVKRLVGPNTADDLKKLMQTLQASA